MIRILIYAATFGLTTATAVPIAYGSSVTAPAKVPRIVSSVQFPQSRWKIVRHTFRLQIPQESKPLSQLTISVPAGLTVKNKNKIGVFDQSGRQVDTNVSVDGSKVTLEFPTPIKPRTELKIAMRDYQRLVIQGFR